MRPPGPWLHKLRAGDGAARDRELLAVGRLRSMRRSIGGRATARQGASTGEGSRHDCGGKPWDTSRDRKLRLGRVRLAVADAPGSKQLVDFARATAATGLTDPHTTAHACSAFCGQEGYTHQYVSGYSSPRTGTRHPAWAPPSGIAAQTVERPGTHHHRVEREHLPYYLDEFTFRFNATQVKGARTALLPPAGNESVNTDPHPLADAHRRHSRRTTPEP